MSDTVQDRGYFSAGSIARIEYADGEIAENPIYARIDTHLSYAGTSYIQYLTCFIETLWVEDDGTVRVRREPVEQMKIILRKAEQPTE